MRFVSAVALGAMLGLAAPACASMVLNVSKSQQRLSVVVDGQELYRWPVSTGRPGYDTPDGVFHAKSMNREWFSRQYEMTPMPWSVFFYQGYALHGTLEGRHLGRAVSHGCVRLDTDHASMLFALVQEQGLDNTKVVITDAPLPRLRRASTALIEEIERRVMPRPAVKVAAAAGGERAAAKEKPEVTPDAKPEPKLEPKAEIKAEAKIEAKLDSMPVEEVRVAIKADRAEVEHAVVVGERGDKTLPAPKVVREDKQARSDQIEVVAVVPPPAPVPPAAPPEAKVIEPAKVDVTPPEPAPPKAPQLAQVEPTPDDAQTFEPAPADAKLVEPAVPDVKLPEPAHQESKQAEPAPQVAPPAEPAHDQAKAIEPAPADVKLPEPAPHRLAAPKPDEAQPPQRARADRRYSSSRGDEAEVLREREAWLRGLAHKYGFERW